MVAGFPSWIRERGTRGEEKKLRAKIETYVKPRDHQLFSGTCQTHDMPAVCRILYSCLGGRLGELTDWDKIEKWADHIEQEAKLRVDDA
jgi:hypothetical protein